MVGFRKSDVDVLIKLTQLKLEIKDRARRLTENQRLMVCALLSKNPNAADASKLFIADALGFKHFPDVDTPILQVVAQIGAIEDSSKCDRFELRKNFFYLKLLDQMNDLVISANFIGNMFTTICSSGSAEVL
jgi:hypothetical protein